MRDNLGLLSESYGKYPLPLYISGELVAAGGSETESKGKDTLPVYISGELVAAGGSETESQHWIRSIRSRIWKPKNINRTGKILLLAL